MAFWRIVEATGVGVGFVILGFGRRDSRVAEYWKFKAIDKLRDYTAQKAALLNLHDEIERLKSEAYSIKSATADGVPVKGGGNGREDRLLSNIVLREELARALERTRKSVESIERGLAVLTVDEKHILDVMYIAREKNCVERLMSEYGLQETSSLYKRVNKALNRFTTAMYGSTES